MKLHNYFLTILVLCFLFSCEDVDTTAPKKPDGPWNVGSITKYSVEPINGGAIVSYELSNDPDIMYVMAEYERNGKIFTEKSSIHTNKLTIEGFHRVSRVKAKLYKVNKYEQKSEPLEIEFEPKESLIDIALGSLVMQAGFGGVVATWDNPRSTELGVRLLTYDDSLYKRFDTREMIFSTQEKGRIPFRGKGGYPPVETTFAISFEDKWGNVSDTVPYTTVPYFETPIAKPYVDYRANIPYDNISNYSISAYNFSKIYNGVVNTYSEGWLSASGSSGLSITLDIKQVVKLSRILHHAYHINSPYAQVNVVEWEIWGTDKIDFTKIPDKKYWLDSLSLATGHIHNEDPTQQLPEKTFKNDWQYFGIHTVPRYTDVNDQAELSAKGAEFEMPVEARPVRYIRLFVRKQTSFVPPPLSNYFSIGELSFFGDNTVPQE